MLIFLHIPKCGGTTINEMLKENFRPDERFEIDPNDILESRKKLSSYPEDKLKSINLLYGHLSYGWHELFSSKAKYFTFVRNPIKRIVSHYNYVRYRLDHTHYLRETVEKENMSIGEYVASGVCNEVNNGMVRLLVGEDIVQKPYETSEITYGDSNIELLEQAIENIDNHFIMVGLQEQFDKSLLLLK